MPWIWRAVATPGRLRRFGAVERGALVRVLAVAGLRDERGGADQRLGKGHALVAREPQRHGGVIGGGQRIGLARQRPPQGPADPAQARDLAEHGVVIRRVGDDCHKFVVFRGGADQGRAADIDILDAGLAVGARGHGRSERVEVADQQVDLADAVRGERVEMVGPVAPRQQPAMHGGMQCLDPPVEHFREAGHLRHLGDRESGLRQGARRAAGRDQRDAARHERPRERRQPRLVADRDQRAADRDHCLRARRIVHCWPPLAGPPSNGSGAV